MKKYQIWFVPTEKGKAAFKWEEQPYRNWNYITKTYDEPTIYSENQLEDAQLECYLLNADDPAPDAQEYSSYKLREV